MGPTNVALVKLFNADRKLREAEAALHDAGASVRQQEGRIANLTERQTLAQTQLREAQASAGQLDLDIKTRDAHIDKLRAQQQNSKNDKEYKVFLSEISTEKIEKNKVEDELIKVMEEIEKRQAELKEINALLDTERQKHQVTQSQLADRLAALQADIDAVKPERDEAATAVPSKAIAQFERLKDRYEGEAMAAVGRPDPRNEEYVCTACNMDLVADVYNRLHARDELVPCPNCRRLLFIPADLPPETAVNKPKERKETRGTRGTAAPAMRQMSAADVSRSISAAAAEAEESTAEAQPADAQPAASAPDGTIPPQE